MRWLDAVTPLAARFVCREALHPWSIVNHPSLLPPFDARAHHTVCLE
eukprot:COSAG01_NODE_28119_length_668_cov_2.991213_1_plen_46_part_10